MNKINQVQGEKISNHTTDLSDSFVDYSRDIFDCDGNFETALQKLREVYPTLSRAEQIAICNSVIYSKSNHQIKDVIMVDNTRLIYRESTPVNCLEASKIDTNGSFYQKLTDRDYFLCHNNPLDGEKVQYGNFIANVLTIFLAHQNINLEVHFDKAYFSIPNNDNNYDILSDSDFTSLVSSFISKHDFSMNLLLLKEGELEMSAVLNQTFDEIGNCTIALRSTEVPYFSLNHGFLKTVTRNTGMTIVPYLPILSVNKLSFPKKNKFPYSAILIDADKVDELIKLLPKICYLPFVPISSFNSNEEMLSFFYQQIESYDKINKKVLIVSENPNLITCAELLNLDTCFINSGLNDTESYHTTFEISKLEKIKTIQMKSVNKKRY